MKSKFFLFLILIAIFPLNRNFTTVSSSTIIATDSINDINFFMLNLSSGIVEKQKNQPNPMIDIKSISYSLNTNGNASISLNLVGKPMLDNTTFYWVSFSNNNISAFFWAGAYTNSTTSECKVSCSSILKDNHFSYSNASAKLDTINDNIIWTLPSQINKFNKTSNQYEIYQFNMPSIPDQSWIWNVLTWSSKNITTNTSQSFNDGSWWEDRLEYSSKNDTYNLSSSSKADTTSIVSTINTKTSIQNTTNQINNTGPNSDFFTSKSNELHSTSGNLLLPALPFLITIFILTVFRKRRNKGNDY